VNSLPSHPLIPAGAPALLRVLLVDDQPDLVEMMRLMLVRYGLVVTVARGVAMAMELAETQPFDVLVSDVGLSDGTGCDLLRRLRAQRHIPAIAMSGSDSDSDLAFTRAAGFDERFTKPVRIDDLVCAIRRVVGSGPGHRDPEDAALSG